MRRFDLTPFQRSTIGFDRLFSLLDQTAGVDAAPSYPPYNIERTGENAYRITLATAGFKPEELTVETRENTLVVRGEKQVSETSEQPEFLYQGIAARSFERRFQLADNVLATGARVEHGLLNIELVHEIPEAKKPRLIPISGGTSTVIEHKDAEAKARKAA